MDFAPIKMFCEFPLNRVALFLVLLLGSLIVSEPVIVGLAASFGVKGTLAVLLWCEIWHLAVCFGWLWLFVKFIDRSNLAEFGFKLKNMLGDFVAGLFLGAILVVLTLVGMSLVHVFDWGNFNSAQDLCLSGITLLFAAATEELIFRAYAFNVIEKSWGTIAAVIFSSLCFGFAHMLNEAGGAAVIDKVLFCSFLSLEAGVSLAACFVLTRRLWMPIAAHWMWNFFEGPIFGTHVSGADFGQSLFTSQMHGPAFLSGGLFGPEGSVICLLLGTAGGVGILNLAWQRNHDFISFSEARRRLKGLPEVPMVADF